MNNKKYAGKKIQLIQILKEINKECDLGAVAVVTFEGREVAFFADKGTDPSIMAALASALNSAGKQAVKQIKYGNLDQLILKGTEGFLILQNAGPVILLAASRETYGLALSMNILSRYSVEVNDVLERE